jgi:hypothetical protein
MKKLNFFFWLISAVLSLPVSALAAATTGTTSISIPISRTVFVPAPCGGEDGENVNLSGSLNIVAINTFSGNTLTTQIKFIPQGVAGEGETTGNTYEGTGATQRTLISAVDQLPREVIEVNNFNIISHGSDLNAREHDLIHITVNAKGETTANIDSSSIICETTG